MSPCAAQTAAEQAAAEVAKAADTAASAASGFSLDQLSLDQLQEDEEGEEGKVNGENDGQKKEDKGKAEDPTEQKPAPTDTGAEQIISAVSKNNMIDTPIVSAVGGNAHGAEVEELKKMFGPNQTFII